MKVYTVNFKGFYPVGACAVVVAKSRIQSKRLFLEKLATLDRGKRLYENNHNISLDSFVEVDADKEGCAILLDGDY